MKPKRRRGCRATFSDVRQRLLPDLTTARYAQAKQAYDRKQYAEAAARFRELVVLLDDPQMAGRHGDMRTLAAGFVELATIAAAPPPAPKEEAKPEPPPAATKPAAPVEPKIYTGDEPRVVPPVTVRQDIPPVPAALTQLTRTQGLLDLVIDEKGRLVSIVLRTGIHPTYDKMIVNAARDWKYKPATLDGMPVQFRKIVQVSVSKR